MKEVIETQTYTHTYNYKTETTTDSGTEEVIRDPVVTVYEVARATATNVLSDYPDHGPHAYDDERITITTTTYHSCANETITPPLDEFGN